jgi:hypothetical protein
MTLSGGLVERYCGALAAVRALIDSASPGAITSYANGLQTNAEELTTLLGRLRTGRADLERVWTRGERGRTTTLNRMDELIRQLTATLTALNSLVPLLNRSASTLASCQRGFATGVHTGSTRIAQILATGNPGAQAAATASAGQSTTALSGLISSFGRLLESLGATGIAPLFNALGQVAGQIQQLSQASGAPTDPLTGSTLPPTTTLPTTPPATQPTTLPATLPASSQLPAFTQYPWTGQQPATEANSWIPVTQPVSPGGGGSGQIEVTVTTRDGDTTTVRAVAGQDAAFDLRLGSEDVHIAIDGDGDGQVAGRRT